MQEASAKIDETKKPPKTVSKPGQDPSVVSSSDGLRQRETSGNQPATRETNIGLAAVSADRSPAQRSQEIPLAPVATPAPLPDAFPAQNLPGNNPAPPLNAGGNQNLQMNAQGGPLMEEEEEMNRDWLDWLYSATLFFVFINIIYFYSSLSRFLMVMGGTVLMYLHHAGWFPFRRQPVHPLPNNVLPQAAINQDQNNNLQEENAGEEGEPEAIPDEGRALPENLQDGPSFMNTAWLFFKTFFASLLPEGPPAVAN
nr:homocysteine-responsive endoplasmic reticulum-resident ubiquitin-like domain member 1 protein isoform X2 [Pelodiscus sinensis]|eukprot:XP_025036280.1 homocysteine-responsive endoplasmic reticulum-resident ubiquitin-like domain member 1 protein isoform X2 [Pelodiscus sinensis]